MRPKLPRKVRRSPDGRYRAYIVTVYYISRPPLSQNPPSSPASLLAGYTYRFSFSAYKFEWDKFDVCYLVSGLIKMLWYRVVSLFCIALRCSTISNLSLKARLVCPMYSAGVFGVLLHLRHCITF